MDDPLYSRDFLKYNSSENNWNVQKNEHVPRGEGGAFPWISVVIGGGLSFGI